MNCTANTVWRVKYHQLCIIKYSTSDPIDMFLSFPHLYTEFIGPCVARALQKNMRLLCCSNGFYCHTHWPLILFKRFRKIGEIHPFCLIFIAKSVLQIILKALEIVVHVLKKEATCIRPVLSWYILTSACTMEANKYWCMRHI